MNPTKFSASPETPDTFDKAAYEQIRRRAGKMVDGIFVKDAEPPAP